MKQNSCASKGTEKSTMALTLSPTRTTLTEQLNSKDTEQLNSKDTCTVTSQNKMTLYMVLLQNCQNDFITM
jgi:hypothetical protein